MKYRIRITPLTKLNEAIQEHPSGERSIVVPSLFDEAEMDLLEYLAEKNAPVNLANPQVLSELRRRYKGVFDGAGWNNINIVLSAALRLTANDYISVYSRKSSGGYHDERIVVEITDKGFKAANRWSKESDNFDDLY